MDGLRSLSYSLRSQNQVDQVDATPLTRLITRLEAATSRLEDIASSAGEGEGEPNANGTPKAPAPSEKGVPAAAAGVAAAGAHPTPKKDLLPPMIEDFDALVQGDLKEYVNLSNGLLSLLAEQVSIQRRLVPRATNGCINRLVPSSVPSKPRGSSF